MAEVVAGGSKHKIMEPTLQLSPQTSAKPPQIAFLQKCSLLTMNVAQTSHHTSGSLEMGNKTCGMEVNLRICQNI